MHILTNFMLILSLIIIFFEIKLNYLLRNYGENYHSCDLKTGHKNEQLNPYKARKIKLEKYLT